MLRRRPAAKKGEVVGLLLCATTSATDRGLIGGQPTAAVDGTGLESRHTSRYFFKRTGRTLLPALDQADRRRRYRQPLPGRGRHHHRPVQRLPQLPLVMTVASLAVTWDRGLADAAFDAEEHHRYCRENLGVRATVIPLNRRGRGRKWSKTRYRRQMVKRSRKGPQGSRHRRVYGQRWQAESAFSRHKRRLGSSLGGRSDASRAREGYLRILTYNLMLLAAHG